jgi:hypothetical protein
MATYNINTTIVNVNQLAPAYQSLGLGPIPPGTTAADGVAAVETKLKANLATSWTGANFPTLPSFQQDVGLMGPWSSNVSGTAPACLVQQITQDFNSWSLPNDQTTINQMATQITTEISANGGITGTFLGRSRLGGSEEIDWGVAFTTGVIVDNPEENGIIYAFGAVLNVTAAEAETAGAGATA